MHKIELVQHNLLHSGGNRPTDASCYVNIGGFMALFEGWLKVSNFDLPIEGEVIVTVEKNASGQAEYDLLTAISYLLECLRGDAYDPRFSFNYWAYVPKAVDLDT
ncbi:hypothetical protein OAO65_02140 [Flavobacteriales bacterium]|nr:hypothetical protein [Flavobacteriales bacterium]